MFGGWDNQWDFWLTACTSTTMSAMGYDFPIDNSSVEIGLELNIKNDCKSVLSLWLHIVTSLYIHEASKGYCDYRQGYPSLQQNWDANINTEHYRNSS